MNYTLNYSRKGPIILVNVEDVCMIHLKKVEGKGRINNYDTKQYYNNNRDIFSNKLRYLISIC